MCCHICLLTERDFIVASQGLLEVSQSLRVENEEFMKRYSDATSKAHQLEEDIVSVTHKAVEKETELDRYISTLKKLLQLLTKLVMVFINVFSS